MSRPSAKVNGQSEGQPLCSADKQLFTADKVTHTLLHAHKHTLWFTVHLGMTHQNPLVQVYFTIILSHDNQRSGQRGNLMIRQFDDVTSDGLSIGFLSAVLHDVKII